MNQSESSFDKSVNGHQNGFCSHLIKKALIDVNKGPSQPLQHDPVSMYNIA